jgi:histidinol dehydrogenase
VIPLSRFSFDHPRFRAICRRSADPSPDVVRTVTQILDDVRRDGDAALARYMQQHDGIDLGKVGARVATEEIRAAPSRVRPGFMEALARACENVRAFHEHQRPRDYEVELAHGGRIRRRHRPIASVGVCVPSGVAPLPSSLYMNVVPAQIAGVPRIAIIAAPRGETIDPHILAVAHHLRVDEVYRISGAQGVAALAYGTESVPRVDKVVGPGNIWTTTAKRLLVGTIGIDSLAGPSEVAIIADASANPAHVAVDLLSQAEHGTGEEAAIAFVVGDEVARAIQAEVAAIAARLGIEAAVEAALARYGNVFIVESLDEARCAVDELAPEHVELLCRDAESLAESLQCYGALFVGPHTPESVGDYYAGSNHVLPTQGTARFASGLGVGDFVRASSTVMYTAAALAEATDHISALADAEGMVAHGEAARIRRT